MGLKVVRNDSRLPANILPKYAEYPGCIAVDIGAGLVVFCIDVARDANGKAFAQRLRDVEATIVRDIRPQADRLGLVRLADVSPEARRAMAMADFLSRLAQASIRIDDPPKGATS